MKFNRLNDDKLQIIVSKDDLLEHDMKKWDLVPYSPVAQKLFQDILEEAYDECGFEVAQDTQLMIEAYPMTGESMIITITKVSNLSKGLFDFDMESLGEMFMDEFVDDEGPLVENDEMVYMFYDLEDAIQLSKLINDHYNDKSALYKCGNMYYLTMDNITALDEKYFGFMSEYGDISHTAPVFVQEHGMQVMEKNAIGILAGL